jgi:hypothetical protein
MHQLQRLLIHQVQHQLVALLLHTIDNVIKKPTSSSSSIIGNVSSLQNHRNRDIMQSPSKQSTGLPAPFTNNQSVPISSVTPQTTTTTSTGNLMNKNIYDSNIGNASTITPNTRSITPIGPPSRNINSSPHSLHIVNTLDLSTPTMGWTNSGDISHQIQHKMNDLHVSSAQALEYSLFNDNYIGNKWAEHKQLFNPLKVNPPFIESEPPVQVDASKAPGYRGNSINSPVSSKTSSNSATPPTTVPQQPTISNVNVAVGGGPPSNIVNGSQQQQQQQQQQSNNQTVTAPSYGEMNVIKSIGQGPNPLAVQRPSNNGSSNNNNNNNRTMDFCRATNLFEPLYSNDAMQSQSQFNAQQHNNNNFGMTTAQQPSMSRLNPKASSFSNTVVGSGGVSSSGKMPSNQYGGNSYNNMSSATNNTNNFMKSPGSNNANNNSSMPQYNRPSMQQQQNLQQQSSRGWFQELGNLGGNMDMSSPSMSPNNNINNNNNNHNNNNNNNINNNNNSQQIQQQQNVSNAPPSSQGIDDSRKVPRPIGTERQSWKYSYGPYGGPSQMQQQHPGTVGGGNILEIDATASAGGPPWIMDKQQQQQQQQQQQWQLPQQQPFTYVRNLYDDLHMQDLMPVRFYF